MTFIQAGRLEQNCCATALLLIIIYFYLFTVIYNFGIQVIIII